MAARKLRAVFVIAGGDGSKWLGFAGEILDQMAVLVGRQGNRAI